ncbi:MAG: hypothetical protein FJ221_15880 [Lentisphaerae bacterium]|nr:hypothetical protein [Lentisphaerota bacterium]
MSLRFDPHFSRGLDESGTQLHYQGREFTLGEFREHLSKRFDEKAVTLAQAQKLHEAWIHTLRYYAIRRQDLFPAVFSDRLDRARLPNPPAFDRVLTWSPDMGRNLIAFGDVGTAKTRAVYHLFYRLMKSIPDDPMWRDTGGDCDDEDDDYGVGWSELIDIPASALATRVRALALRDPVGVASFTRHLRQARILFIDDITQIRLTDRLAEVLYDVIDARYRNNRPLIVTSQVGADELVGKLAHGDKSLRITARAIVRRISQDGRAMAVDFDAPVQPSVP